MHDGFEACDWYQPTPVGSPPLTYKKDKEVKPAFGPVDTPDISYKEQKVVEPTFGPVPSPPNTQEEIKYNFPQQNNPPILAPLPHLLPPKHTQVQPRCFTCKHFEMCSYRRDYLKTITLIQNSLGAPQADYQLTNNYITIPNFIGFPLVDQQKYLPEEVDFDNSNNKGKLFLSKFNGINYVNIVYLELNHYILIQLKYNKDSELYELKSCEEAFYGVSYELAQKSLEEIQLGLVEWRDIVINSPMPPPPPRPDIINTTHFSAMVNCDMYEWNRESFEEALIRLSNKYPFGIPIDGEGKLYHIATYHIADREVPYSPCFDPEILKDQLPKFALPPTGKVPAPPRRRGDM